MSRVGASGCIKSGAVIERSTESLTSSSFEYTDLFTESFGKSSGANLVLNSVDLLRLARSSLTAPVSLNS